MSPKISVIIPVFNEERTILQVIDEILTILPQAHIAVFDNNSTDNSKNLVLEKIKSLQMESAPKQLDRIFAMRGGGKQLFKGRI
ncbi:glycosyltransferase [Helicobacter himalayensis]|uniref:glycosyltransferase n=1 Tax=Helicobacter himalayensis TaxID=1591088 RepID=UPI003D6F90EF